MATGTAAIIGAIATVGGTLYSIDQQAEAEESREEANAAARKSEEVRARRQRVQAARQNRIQRAEVFAQATNAGAGTSSGTMGALGASRSREAAGVGFTNQMDALQGAQIDAQMDARGSMIDARGGQQFGNIVSSVASGAAAGYDYYQGTGGPSTSFNPNSTRSTAAGIPGLLPAG